MVQARARALQKKKKKNCKKCRLSSLAAAKLALLLLLGPFTLAFSRTPWLLQRFFTARALDALNVLSALSAGIVFGSFMTHLLPEAEAAFSAALPLSTYPWAPLVVGATASLLLAADKLIVARGLRGIPQLHHHDHVSGALEAMRAVAAAAAGSAAAAVVGGARAERVAAAAGEEEEAEDAALILQRGGPLPAADPPPPPISNSSQNDNGAAMVRAWVFFLALSLHSFFDGLGLGSEDAVAGFWGIFVAVCTQGV